MYASQSSSGLSNSSAAPVSLEQVVSRLVVQRRRDGETRTGEVVVRVDDHFAVATVLSGCGSSTCSSERHCACSEGSFLHERSPPRVVE